AERIEIRIARFTKSFVIEYSAGVVRIAQPAARGTKEGTNVHRRAAACQRSPVKLRHQSLKRSTTPRSHSGFIGTSTSIGSATAMTSSAHPGFAPRPVGYSIHVSCRPSGSGAFQDVVPMLAIRRDQTASDPDDPVSPVGALSS